MLHPALLCDRTYNLNEGRVNWYSALKFLESYPSVKLASFYETCSSAGDWSGYILQTIGKQHYIIMFWQSNNYPRNGFTIHTDEYPVIMTDVEMGRDQCKRVINNYLEEFAV